MYIQRYLLFGFCYTVCVLFVPITEDRPTMMELVSFRGRERRINIPQEIGTEYNAFGVLLLEDRTGARIQNIVSKHMKDPERINMEVLQKWIEGRGKKPVTWEALVEVLRDMNFNTLADDIAVCYRI